MTSRMSRKILTVVNRWVKQVQKDWCDVNGDPLADLKIFPDTHRDVILEEVPAEFRDSYDFNTRVVGFENKPRPGMVTLLLDGTAFDLLSYDSDLHTYRTALEEALEKIGCYIEDCSACAISIQEL
jgi:hypothetical protein